jgi:sugar phosphate isomerase/epimerase
MKQLILLLLTVTLLGCTSPKKELDNVFYPFNNSMTSLPNAPQGFDQQAAFLKQLGFDGYGGHTRDDYFKRRPSLDKAGLSMPELYWGMDMDSVGNITYDKKIKEIIKDSKDRDLVVSLFTTSKSYMSKREEGDPLFAKEIQELADYAAEFNVKLGLYPHVDLYVEEIGHSVKLAKLVNRNNVGAIFNICHFLKKEGAKGWEGKISNALPYLFMVSINGADSGDTQKMDWDRLIQPLGEGTFDIYPVVKYLKDKGYDGPIGLQCYNIKQDAEVALGKSIKTWRSYQKRYAEETN